jgi:hypothetical protein
VLCLHIRIRSVPLPFSTRLPTYAEHQKMMTPRIIKNLVASLRDET